MLKRLFHIVLVLLLLSACGGREAQRMLERAEAVMNENPCSQGVCPPVLYGGTKR